MAGSWWRGRPVRFDPDAQKAEQKRQAWVYRETETVNRLVRDLAVDPRREYEIHREAFERTGSERELMLMLEYVQ